jgi:hypothetical protein
MEEIRGSIRVDDRLMSQLDRLEKVSSLSSDPKVPGEWRLGKDSCFLKLAYWPTAGHKLDQLAPGMYLPLSYVRLLLRDDCTRGRSGRGDARYLGYGYVDRHLVGSQFVELVKHGLAGTVGTSASQLRELVEGRSKASQSVVMAIESSGESVGDRQRRNRDRGRKMNRYSHSVYNQETLF